MKKLLLVMMLSLGPMSAQAVPITFNWTSNGSDGLILSGSGSWTLDDSVLIPGTNNYAASITAFQFNWNTSAGAFSVSSGTGALDFAILGLDSSLNLGNIFFDVCASTDGACSLTSHPVIRVRSNRWIASLSTGSNGIVRQPQTVTVPEPGTLGLLGIGILGLVIARRRKWTA